MEHCAFAAPHLQVPGEMFELAMAARRERGMGVVGSTQNILDFIAAKLSAALEQPFGDKCAPLPQTGLSLPFMSPAQPHPQRGSKCNALCRVGLQV